jgi:tRNA-binding protein
MIPRKPQVPATAFAALDVRAGRIVRAEPFPEAREPAFKLWVDFGDPVGILPSSAQLTRRYAPETLVDTPVLAVVNVPPRRIAGFRSDCLVLGVMHPDDPGDVVLVRPDRPSVEGWPLG